MLFGTGRPQKAAPKMLGIRHVDGQSSGFDDRGSAVQSFDLSDDGEVGDNLASSADAARRYDSHESRL
jgi:hypothetical protein